MLKSPVAGVVAVLGTIAMTLWMSNPEPLPLGPLWGAVIAAITSGAWTVFAVSGSSEPPRAARVTCLAKREDERFSPLAWAAFALLVLIAGAALGGYDALPLTILSSLCCLGPPARHRPGLAVMLVVAALYLPLLGVTGLWDPWETHYGEVAREILARNDWISLWWAQDKWFWSKPALLFWMEAWTMGVLGIDFMPDANPAHPEWALRLPSVSMALVALAFLYLTMRRIFGTRAAALSVLVIATLPQFLFIAHQAITDMPLVAAITVACCFLLLAVREDATREAVAIRVGRFDISLRSAVVFVLIVLVLPQAAYLISRNFSLVDGHGLALHPDRFLYGSAGNVDVPGNPSPRDQLPAISGVLGQPFLQGLFWLGVLGALVAWVRKERSARALLMVGFYVCCALGFMVKGLPGIVIPGAAALSYLIASGRWNLLGSGQLRVSLGVLVVCAVSLPWYVAMYVRHGAAFINRLFIHDHINRLAAGVHGDQGSVGYFVTQLGYAIFPWIALLPLALLGIASGRRRPSDDREQTLLFMAMWLLSSFALFSAMMTKYHHYILPAIVPAGVLIAVALAEIWGPRQPRATLLAGMSAVFFVVGFAWLFGDIRGVVPESAARGSDWVLAQGEPVWACAALAIGFGLAVAARWDLEQAETHLRTGSTETAIGVALVLGACILVFVGRDLSWATSARPQGNERMIHLFVYKYERPWPDHLDYRAILGGFAVAAGALTVLASLRRWRAFAVRAAAGAAVAFCAWGSSVYLSDVATHWSIRDLAARYYAERAGPEEPLLAWQMNWKGENFYTGNRVYVFAETDNKRLMKWLAANPGRRIYVVLEHKRLERFKELVRGREVTPLSTARENNKLLLVALEI